MNGNMNSASRLWRAIADNRDRTPEIEGFSLIEIVVAVAVLSILSAIAIPNFLGVTDDASARVAQQAVLNAVKECQASKARRRTTLRDAFTASSMGDFIIFGSNRGASGTDADHKATIRSAITLRGNETQEQIVDDGEKGTTDVASTSCFDETGDLRDIFAVPKQAGRFPSFKSSPEGQTKCLSGDESKYPKQFRAGCDAPTGEVGKWN